MTEHAGRRWPPLPSTTRRFAAITIGLVMGAVAVAVWLLMAGQPRAGVDKGTAISSARQMAPTGARVIEAMAGRCDALSSPSAIQGCGHDVWVWAIDFDRGLSRSCGSASGPKGCGPPAQSTRVLVDYFSGRATGAQSPTPGRS
jgi:hypothetical protein